MKPKGWVSDMVSIEHSEGLI